MTLTSNLARSWCRGPKALIRTRLLRPLTDEEAAHLVTLIDASAINRSLAEAERAWPRVMPRSYLPWWPA